MIMPSRTRGLAAALAPVLLAACVATPPPSSQNNQAQVDSSLRAAALASQEVRNYAGAAAYYSSLYERDTKDLDVVMGFARNLRYLGDVGRAAAVLEAALEDNPDDERLLGEYGRALLAADRPADALVPLERVAEGAPDDWQIRSALGIAYDMVDRHDEAVAAYEAALAIAPGSPSALNNLALSQAMAGDIDAGVATLRRASLRTGAGVQVRQNLALLLALSGRLDEAEKLVAADLPAEMARRNIAYLRRLAEASGEDEDGEPALGELGALPVLTNLPTLEPVPSTAEIVAEPLALPAAQPEPEAGATAEDDGDFAAAAAEAADAAFAALVEDGAAGYGAQLASYTSAADAEQGRATLERKLGVLDPVRELRIVPVDRDGADPIFRVYAGSFTDVDAARTVCRAVRERGVACVVTPAPTGP
ncbi:MAG: tetratricopeptide repeat protein [Alphaproteobacteria bacterium]